MINGEQVIGIIPARSGSKRLLNKNKLIFLDKPLITWSIKNGLKNKYIDKLIVSTDDLDIIKIAKKSGSNTILRPKKLARDNSSSFSVVQHVINEEKDKFGYVILLQPTSPLRNNRHINGAFEILKANKTAKSVISVCKVDHPPQWSNIIPKNGKLDNFIKKEYIGLKSQDFPQYYRLNGAIFICKVNDLMREKRFILKENSFPYKMDRYSSIDIDDEYDFKMAEYYFNKMINLKEKKQIRL